MKGRQSRKIKFIFIVGQFWYLDTYHGSEWGEVIITDIWDRKISFIDFLLVVQQKYKNKKPAIHKFANNTI